MTSEPSPRATASFYVLRNFTVESLETPLQAAARARGLGLHVAFGPYDSYLQEALDPASGLAQEKPDAVLLILALDNLKAAWAGEGALNTQAVVEHIETTVAELRRGTATTVIVATFLPPLRWVGAADAWAALGRINESIRAIPSRDPSILILDVERIAARLGLERSVDRRFWFLYKAPFTPELLDALARDVVARLAQAKGLGRKVLVLDCDDTLWGGIVGEDGPTGIVLDPDSHPGNIYYLFQQQVLELRRGGVLLAIASKNNEADVLEVLDQHPHCLLRREHFAAWHIGWESKVEGLRDLAEKLRLGLDTFVLVDDSPVECQLVREALPMVDVLKVPRRVSDLPRLLAEYDGFAAGDVTTEDRERSRYYQEERARASAQAQFASVGDFLRSLALRAEVGPPRPDEMVRVAQLTQRTNQFNLTTRRYDVAGIDALLQTSALVLVLVAGDRFGDYGLTGVAIAVREGDNARIDSFLLSCRILGRQMEDLLLAELCRAVEEAWRPRHLFAEFIATAKNAQTREFLDRRGFRRLTGDDVRTRYERDRERSIGMPDVISLIRRDPPWTSA